MSMMFIIYALAVLGVLFIVIVVNGLKEDFVNRRKLVRFKREHPERYAACKAVTDQGVANWTAEELAKALLDEQERRGLL